MITMIFGLTLFGWDFDWANATEIGERANSASNAKIDRRIMLVFFLGWAN